MDFISDLSILGLVSFLGTKNLPGGLQAKRGRLPLNLQFGADTNKVALPDGAKVFWGLKLPGAEKGDWLALSADQDGNSTLAAVTTAGNVGLYAGTVALNTVQIRAGMHADPKDPQPEVDLPCKGEIFYYVTNEEDAVRIRTFDFTVLIPLYTGDEGVPIQGTPPFPAVGVVRQAVDQASASYRAGNTLYVDAVNGNNGTAARGTRAAFATLTAAKLAAQAGDLIVVGPGVYNENDLAKHGVNWHFAKGANIVYTGSAPHGIFDDWAGPVTTSISGEAEIIYSATTATGNGQGSLGPIMVNNAGSAFNVSCRVLRATTGGGGGLGSGAVVGNAGVLRVQAFLVENTAQGGSNAALWWNGGEMHVHAFQIRGNGSYTIYTNAVAPTANSQALWVRANYIQGTYMTLQGDAASQIWIEALEIDMTGTPGLQGVAAFHISCAGPKIYITAQKLYGNLSSPSYLRRSSGVLLVNSPVWLSIQKLTQKGGGCGLVVSGPTGKLYGSVYQFEDNAGTAESMLKVIGGTADLQVLGMTLVNASAYGVEHTGGTLRLRDTVVNAAAATSGNPILVSGAGLTLSGCSLVAAPGRESIGAASAQSVNVYGATVANTAKNANVTLQVNPAGFIVDANVS